MTNNKSATHNLPHGGEDIKMNQTRAANPSRVVRFATALRDTKKSRSFENLRELASSLNELSEAEHRAAYKSMVKTFGRPISYSAIWKGSDEPMTLTANAGGRIWATSEDGTNELSSYGELWKVSWTKKHTQKVHAQDKQAQADFMMSQLAAIDDCDGIEDLLIADMAALKAEVIKRESLPDNQRDRRESQATIDALTINLVRLASRCYDACDRADAVIGMEGSERVTGSCDRAGKTADEAVKLAAKHL